MLVGAQAPFHVNQCNRAVLELAEVVGTPSWRHSAVSPTCILATFWKILNILVADFAFGHGNVLDLLHHLADNVSGLHQLGEARLLQLFDGDREEGQVTLDEGQVVKQAVLVHQLCALSDALGVSKAGDFDGNGK